MAGSWERSEPESGRGRCLEDHSCKNQGNDDLPTTTRLRWRFPPLPSIRCERLLVKICPYCPWNERICCFSLCHTQQQVDGMSSYLYAPTPRLFAPSRGPPFAETCLTSRSIFLENGQKGATGSRTVLYLWRREDWWRASEIKLSVGLLNMLKQTKKMRNDYFEEIYDGFKKGIP